MTSQLETLVNTVQNLYQQQSYQEIYNTISTNMELLQRNQQNLRNLLQIFPLPEFTIAHMAVLHVLTSNVQTINPDLIINEIHACLVNIDEKQIQYASDILSSLCGTYTNKLCDNSRPKNSALLLLYNLIKKIQKTPNQLTSLHSHLLQLSLVSKNFSLALDVMANDVLDINKENQTYESKAFLEYFYFSGCILAAIKNYDKALFFFEQAITLLPCNAISQIMVESYKKFILISLIHRGKLNLLPKYTSRIVINQIKPMCNAYHELVCAFVNCDIDKLNATILKFQSIYQHDMNFGLIKQVEQTLIKKSIQKLTKTYMTLSLSDMAVKVKLRTAKDAESYLINMIKDGEIYANINQKDGGMVLFNDNPEKYDNTEMIEYLNDKMFSLIDYDKKIIEMDREITTHPHYIQKCMNSMQTGPVDDLFDQPMAVNR